MRPPKNGTLTITQLFGGNPRAEQYVDENGFLRLGHDGIDIAAEMDEDVYAPIDGKLTIINSGSRGFGLHIIIKNRDGSAVLLGHLSSVLRKDGAYVMTHVPIAKAGSSGNSTGPHIHLSHYPQHPNRQNGYGGTDDPITYFDSDVYPRLDLTPTNL